MIGTYIIFDYQPAKELHHINRVGKVLDKIKAYDSINQQMIDKYVVGAFDENGIQQIVDSKLKVMAFGIFPTVFVIEATDIVSAFTNSALLRAHIKQQH